MNTRIAYILPFILMIGMILNSFHLYSQTHYKTKTYNLPITKQYKPSDVKVQWFANLQNIDTVFQGNENYHRYVQELKNELKDHQYSFVHEYNKSTQRVQSAEVDTPMVSYAFEGNLYSGSVPNDNTMAISNDGIVVASINTNIIFYDTKTDSLLKTVSLSQFSDTLTGISTHQYDPKAIYDYKEDRFILVYLSGASSATTSDIIIAFSSSSNPMDEWNFYTVPGNPLLDTSWTDYPAISLSNDELIITGNLLKYGGSWQTSFKQSVVWQIDKFTGYEGDSLESKLYYDINYNGKNVRNIHPVRGGDAFYGPEIYLLSNQNFAVESDAFYMIKIDGLMGDPSTSLSVDLLLSDTKYGMPPNAQQVGTKRLATNDARVLGAFYQNGEIQFVGNSIRLYVDTDTNRLSSFYHGVIKGVIDQPELHLNVYSDKNNPYLEFGYPNLSYCGTNSISQHSLISFDYAAADLYPGVGAAFFEKDDTYSNMTNLKSGDTYIYILFGTQRWGDYSGSQPKYNEPGKVWLSGTFGKSTGGKRAYGTWIAEIYSNVEDMPIIPTEFSARAYPNPPQDHQMHIEFDMLKAGPIQIEIVDINGKIVDRIFDSNAKAGMNMFSFSTLPLNNGMYVIRMLSEGEIIYSQKIIVIQ